MGASGGFSTSSSDPTSVSPYGGLPFKTAQGFNRGFAAPLSAYFGVTPEYGSGPKGQRREARYNRQMEAVQSGNDPLSQYIRQAGSFLPSVFGQAQDVGQRIASRAPGIFNQVQQQVQGALGRLSGLQDTAQGATGRAGQAVDQAFSPIASQALYQNALRGGLEGVQSGAAGRGLLDAGTAQAREETFGRDLAAQYAQNQFTNQQAALGGQQQAMGLQAGLLPMGAQLAGMEGGALQQLQQALQAGYQLPQEALASVFQQLAAFQNPQLALLGLAAPSVANKSDSFAFNQSGGITG